MTDIERLAAWMTANGHDKKSLAIHMDEKYITIWAMMDRDKPSDRFVSNFIRHFGCDEAVAVFADHLAPKQP
jgi:hypothetical protein